MYICMYVCMYVLGVVDHLSEVVGHGGVEHGELLQAQGSNLQQQRHVAQLRLTLSARLG